MFTVYRLFDADGSCIYVGCSEDPWARVKAHARRPDLTDLIARVEMSYHNSSAEAFAHEAEEIRRLTPALNVRMLIPVPQPRHPDGALRERVIAAMSDIGEPTTSKVLAEKIGARATSVATLLLRLRGEEVVRTVGTTGGGKDNGRPMYLVELVGGAA
jgi:hypothetical protein